MGRGPGTDQRQDVTNRLLVLPEAGEELEQAALWYEGEAAGLGVRFLAAVHELFTFLASSPRIYPVVYQDVRRALVPKFPYGVFYQPRGQAIRVLAVVHLHRAPGAWREQVAVRREED